MEHESWKRLKFDYPTTVPTMISTEEKLYLYWLGKSVWSGQGAVVEIGPWLGGSTICLAAGMRASKHDVFKRLHVFDNFIWRDFMAARASLPLKSGDSFESFFLENTQNYEEIIESHAQVLPDEAIKGDSEATRKRFFEVGRVPVFEGLSEDLIEILFIDGAKSWRGMCHLLQTLRNRLIPGKSLLVCQDYKYWGTYWVSIMMMRLEKYFEPVHNVLKGTTVTFRLISEIPSGLLESFGDSVLVLPTNQTLTVSDRASRLLAGDGDALGAANVLLSKISFLSHQNEVELAVEQFKKIQKSWPLLLNSSQLERAREYLNAQKSCDLPRPKSLEMVIFLQKVWRNLKSWG